MHISLDAALQRQPLLSTVGDKLLPAFPGAAAAYSLRALNGDANNVVNVRRDADDEERDFTAEGVAFELEDWVNGKLETTLPADVDTAAAAYSLRKVRTAYSGNAVQIRRVPGDVEVNVAFDSNGEVSTSSAITNVDESPDAGDTTATTLGEFLTEGGNQDATVVTWYDQSGNGNDATQLTTGNQPLIAQNGSLLADGIDFDGFNDFFDVSGIDEAQPITGFIQLKPDATTDAANEVLDGTIVNTNRILLDASSGDWRLFAGSVLTGASVATTSSLLYFLANSTSSEFGLNGATALTGNAGTNSGWADGLTIGTSISGNFYDGTIGEIIFYPSDQSTNRFKIESNINNYYGIYTAAEDGFVETWYDQSGNGNDAVQDTVEGYQPKIVSAGSLITKNGKPSMEFTKANQNFLNISGKTSQTSSVESVFAVYQNLNDGVATSLGSNSSSYLVFANGLNYAQFGAGGFTGDTQALRTTGLSTSEFRLHSIFRDNGNTRLALFADGVLKAESTIYTAAATNTFSIIGGRGALGTTDNMQGHWSELILFNSDQSANRTGIESNIADEYGITLS
jgi:hypothetical protein